MVVRMITSMVVRMITGRSVTMAIVGNDRKWQKIVDDGDGG